MPRNAAPVRPSAAIQATYERRLDDAIGQMTDSLIYWLSVEYRRTVPGSALGELAGDASAPRALQAAVARLSKRWLKNFSTLAWKLSGWFATSVESRSTVGLRESLRSAGFTVRFKPTKAMNEAFQAVLADNVALIKSIPEQHLKSVEGAVMRSVMAGRDLGGLVDELRQIEGVTKRRARTIARTQNNQATAIMTRVRQLEAGITRARWLHSAGGNTPRPEHVAFSGKTYDIATGADVEGRWPGVAINCRCVSVPVIPGFDD